MRSDILSDRRHAAPDHSTQQFRLAGNRLSETKFNFPIIDISGDVLRQPGLWGSIGFSEKYRGTLSDDDSLIQAIGLLHKGETVSAHDLMLVRSFCIAWLTSYRRNLSSVVGHSISLPKSIGYIDRIGLLDRTAKKVVAGAAGIAVTVLFLEYAWEASAVDYATMSELETVVHVMEQIHLHVEIDKQLNRIFEALDKSVGRPGEPTKRAAFNAQAVSDFLQVVLFQKTLHEAAFDPEVLDGLQQRLNDRIFGLFLANSRQIQGLILAGASEASAAVVAHAAIALALCELPDVEQLFDALETRIDILDDDIRASEARETLRAMRENQNSQTAELERRLNRYLDSTTVTEAIDLATSPVTTTFELLGSIADGIGQFSGETKAATFLRTASEGFKLISRTIDSAPDGASHLIGGGVAAEAWTRSMASKLWPFKKDDD